MDATTQSTLLQALRASYLGAGVASERHCLVLQGKAGRGKNHLPVGDAHLAIQSGPRAHCETAAESIDTLSQAGRDGRFRAALAADAQPGMLLLDTFR